MPKYTYECLECKKIMERRHSIKTVLTICDCEKKGKLKRIPSIPRVFNKTKKSDGKIVKKFIEEIKEDLKKDKEKLSRDREEQ